jgi:phage terminase small subunit
MKKNLSEKQQKFLDVLFAEANGDYVKAKKLAGYSENTATADITRVLRDEIKVLTEDFIGMSSAKAAYTMYDVMVNPTELGNKERMNAARDLLDRAGFKPKEKIEVSAPNPLFILPAKSDEQ